MKTKLAILSATLLVVACGAAENRKTNSGESDKPADTTKTTTDTGTSAATGASIADDETLAGQDVSAQIDEGVAALTEENDNDAGGATLTDASAQGDFERYRKCTVVGDTASVEIHQSLSRSWSIEGPLRSASASLEWYREATRVWSKAGTPIVCSANQKYANVPVRDMAGVSLAVTFKRNYDREATYTFKKKNIKEERSVKMTAEGTRNVSWKTVKEADGVLTIDKEVTSAVERTLDTKNKKGDATSLASSVSSAADKGGAPLAITVERDAATLDFKSRTIHSGKLVATRKDGGRVETTFAEVKYTEDGKCQAVSGKISGAIFDKDKTEAAATYEINFADGGGSIVFSNGKEFDYAPDGCDLDDPTDATEETDASDVKQPPAPAAPT